MREISCATCQKFFETFHDEGDRSCFLCSLRRITTLADGSEIPPETGDFNTAALISGDLSVQEEDTLDEIYRDDASALEARFGDFEEDDDDSDDWYLDYDDEERYEPDLEPEEPTGDQDQQDETFEDEHWCNKCFLSEYDCSCGRCRYCGSYLCEDDCSGALKEIYTPEFQEWIQYELLIRHQEELVEEYNEWNQGWQYQQEIEREDAELEEWGRREELLREQEEFAIQRLENLKDSVSDFFHYELSEIDRWKLYKLCDRHEAIMRWLPKWGWLDRVVWRYLERKMEA